jgi:hypothetical protein
LSGCSDNQPAETEVLPFLRSPRRLLTGYALWHLIIIGLAVGVIGIEELYLCIIPVLLDYLKNG